MAADARDHVTDGDRSGRAAHGPAPALRRVDADPATFGAPAWHALARPADARSEDARPADGDTPGEVCAAAPALVLLPEAAGPREAVSRLRAHGCCYPSAGADGAEVAFICDRGGVPQLWAGPVNSAEVRLLDSSPDPVTEVSWSPDGRWIAYTTAPGGGEHSRVLCVRPDGSGRRVLAGADPGSTAYLGCWSHDGSCLAVTVTAPPARTPGEAQGLVPVDRGPADSPLDGALPPAGWADRGGHATLLGASSYDAGTWHGPTAATGTAAGATSAGPTDGTAPAAATVRPDGGLSVYLIDPDGLTSPALLTTETHAATLRACDLSRDGSLVLLRRGPRGRREAVVRRTDDATATFALPVADGDPWIGRFSPDARTLWLRSNADREHAALLAVLLDADGRPEGASDDLLEAPRHTSVVAEREGCDLELLAMAHDGRTAALAWNTRGASELELVETFPAFWGVPARQAPDRTGPARPVPLPHEVVTRVTAAGVGRLLLALSGSQRRPGVWWAHEGVSLLRTPWSSRDEDAVPPGRPPVRPVPLRLTARDGLPLSGWYYRAPGRPSSVPAPCVIHLHGGPEEQERPVLHPLYHELTGRGLDVFAPDVRGSSGHGRSFVDADLGAGRFAALDDVADCAAHIVTTGLADPTRLAVMGRSYGGYLTFASLVWHPDLFRTGVAVCGMSDFLTFFAATEPWLAESAAHKYGHPDRDRELLRSLSPMTRVDALRVPVLAVHGEHDTNVPPEESRQFVRAARERGLAAELLTLRDEGHDFLRADNRRLFRRAAADWMERHLLL
ncbi:dipeptidyl aminopeptidase/acylaminoacyl peptidase [Streptomyces achromogenes]|uniref:Dipeptidyl aminopeptidase/acylaminoacyl peptidase n=1 Tax=Streptomyces achromogenes TaxID=67255 RepID=A0ABU0QCD4_STRAH|nr:prolyl oligopeptidase family serine peptidase [Streptomyces achromogenes]MDQ0688322.1 dipeptidyl aminopeptidase/acylaminoacyl peptidase [Streptomyces achromogenes]